MLEPNDAEFAAENADEACKSDYFSDEGDTKNDSVKSENTLSGKRKPGDNDVLESKKIKISEHPSSKSSAASQPNTSEFVRAGSVASDNSDEFVDASDVLLDAPPLPDKTSKNDSRLVKSPPPGDTFKSSVFEPEVPKVKDNKFIKRLPTFADDPLERFNSSVLRRGLVREVEPTKPIDLNFDFGDKDKNEPKGENKAVKKVKLNRSKFFPTGRPKFSDESSSDSNSKFNTTTSPVKSDIPPPLESKERNFKSVNNICEDKPIKPAVQEKPSVPVEPLPVVQKNEKLHVGVKPAPEPETSSASMKNATKLPESIIPVSQPLPAEPVERKVTGDKNVLPPKPVNVNVSEANDIENIAEDEITDSKHNKPLQEIEEEITLLHSEQDVTQPTDEVDKIVISEETFEEIDQNVIYTTEKNSPQITEEMTPGTEKADKLEDAAPLNTEDEFPLNSNDCIEIDTDDDNQQEKYAESIDQLVNEEIQPTLDMASESPEIVPQPSEYENISVTDINVPNTESPSNLQSAGIIEEVLSDTATDTILEEELIDIQIPVETEVVSIMDTEPEAKTVENADSASEVDDLQEDKSEHELSNDESEEDGEEEEDEDEEGEEEEEEEIIHEEEVYLEDRLPVYHSRPESPSPKRKSPSPQPALSPPRHIGNDVIEVDSDESQPAAIAESSEAQESPVQEPHRATSFENIEDIPMEVDDDHKIPSSSSDALLSDDQTKPKGLSKLEQALTSKPPKRPEVQVPEISDEEVKNVIDDYVSEPKENEETKEKIKLHLSLQGDKVCIKKGPVDTTPAVVRVKRQYRKRRLEDLKTTDKTYKLRNRTIKKDGEGNEPSQSNDTVEVVNVKEKPIEVSAPIERKQILVPSRSGEPLTIDLDDSDSSSETSKQPPATKIQPIKLKIGKNANVTIESGPLNEDVRKKDAAFPNYMEQAATAWSGPDLQRVERLLKESNITITPVVPKDSTPQTPTPCVIKPILKEKPTVVPPKFSTPSSAITAATSLQTTTAAVTPITKDKRDDQEIDLTPTKTQNGDSCELEESLPKIKIDLTPVSLTRQIDVKSEIRKKLASVEKKKQDSGKESNDSESESDSKPKPKSVPDLIPANFPTPEMLQSLASSLGVNTTPEGESADGKSKPDIDPAFLPLLQTLPKKRGRPTKAMVAAREALKQSQETALENLRQLASQKNGDTEELMAHFPIPLFDMTDPENPFKSKRGRKPRSERLDKSDGDQSAVEDPIMDPVREQEEIKRLEEERIKKEEEKERRNEIRRQKARERNDLVKAKRLRQKMKAEERQKRMQEKRRQLQEEKKKLEEEIKNLPQSIPGFDDETRMSAENSQLQTTSYSIGMGDEDSSNATTEFSQRVKKGRMEVTDADSKDLTVDQIAEYQWPIQGGDLYMIQEQVSNYLGVKSFKRKYPDIKRRPVDSEERAYLVDSGLVSETLCDLGLTAVSSAELLDIMCADFPDKYEELRRYMREKQMKELSFKQKAWASGLGYKFLMADGTKQDLKKRAMDAASNWNSALNKSRSEDRRCAMDLQTFIVHYPKDRTQKMSISTPKMGSYPVSILPGQFCDFYKSYTSTELRYMPINTVLYGPLKPHDVNIVGDGSQTDSDDSSSSDESSTTSEGTQATEDTIEDTDKDMSVDESSQLDKTNEINMLKDAMSMELSENTRELIMDEAAKILCKVCLGNMARNKENVPEVLICCSQCSSTNHPTCLDLSLDMVPHIKKYPWQCPDCKICARCKTNTDEDKMLFCDTCDRGYHIFCVGLKRVPSGNWQCQECVSVEHNICINSSVVREVFKEPGLIEIQDG